MSNRLISLLMTIAFIVGCTGEYTDVYYPSQSNCVVTNYAEFSSSGYQLYHTFPNRCPIYFIEQNPWLGARVGFQGVIVAPSGSPIDVIDHHFYNWVGAPVGNDVTVMREDGIQLRGDIYTSYVGGTVQTGLNEFKSDFADNTPHGLNGFARVHLPYTATRAVAIGPGSALENEFFQLLAYPAPGVGLTEPVTYQWFLNDQEYGSPTTSNYTTAWLSGSGFTATFRVDATDANGVTTSNKTWVTVPANCSHPPCEAQ